jgi:hypothetical protein
MAIVTKTLMQPTVISPKWFVWAYIAAFAFMAYTVFLLLFSPFLLIVYMLVPVIVKAIRAPKVKVEAERALRAFAGGAVKFLDVDVDNATEGGKIIGSGIAYADRTLYMMDKGIGAKIPWDEVREWRWEIPGAETFLAVGNIRDRTAANLATGASKSSAALRSGLFVSISDVQKPEWKFRCQDEKVLKRWNEILTQVNEEKL